MNDHSDPDAEVVSSLSGFLAVAVSANTTIMSTQNKLYEHLDGSDDEA